MATLLRHVLPAALALVAAATHPDPGAAAPAQAFAIEAGPLDSALLAFANQSHVQLMFASETVRGLSAPSLHGRFTIEAGLARLLAASGLSAVQSRPGVIAIRKTPIAFGAAPHRDPADPPSGPASSDARAAQPASPSAPPAQPPASAAPVGARTKVEELVVTGSLIRGDRRGPSPVLIMSRDDLDRTGRATLADALADLPQNFGGLSTPQTAVLGTDRVGANDVVSSGVNLRGLGPNATLVLINGRRMAGSGLMGDFADVSAIPTAAIERVEILLDGASALYGSDAVGGVVNIILRQNYDGAETRARYGVASGGAAADRQLAQTVGKTWDSGRFLLSYEYDQQDALPGSKRAFAASADLRGLGGSDHRLIYSLPGNVMTFDPAAGAYVPGWAIPSGQDGTALTPASFLAGQVNLGDQRLGADILPAQTRNSVYASFGQSLTARLGFDADLRYSLRRFAYRTPGSPALIQVSQNNPYFVSPDGRSSDLIAYSFTPELGPVRSTGSSESLGASAGLTAELGSDWQAELYGAYAQESGRRSSTHRLNTYFLNEAVGAIPDDPRTAFSTAQDGFFNPYGDGRSNSRTILDFISGGFVRTHDLSQVATISAKADGSLIQLPGGELKAAVGLQFRQERFLSESLGMTSGPVPVSAASGPFQRTVSAGFVEVRAPIVGSANARPGIERLELSLAGRVEDYDRIGVTANPKIGLIWSPAAGMTVKASYGTSFRAPALSEMYQLQEVAPAFLPSGNTQKLVLLRFGGNPDLKPETATSWTAQIEYAPPALQNLRISLGWFDTRFTAQIGQPVGNDIFNALTNPIYASFVRLLNPSSPADLALVNALLAQSSSSSAGLFPPSAYAAVVHARFVNTGGLHVQGLDASASDGWRIGAERFDLSADASYLIDYQLQVTDRAKAVQMLDLAGEPVRLRAKASASWTHGPFTTAFTVNQVGAYHDLTGRSIKAWTTLDAQLRWRSQAVQGSLKGLALTLSAENLFDAAPPFYDAPQGVGYDPANANALGRVVSLELTKRW